jgi:hypothetical protein
LKGLIRKPDLQPMLAQFAGITIQLEPSETGQRSEILGATHGWLLGNRISHLAPGRFSAIRLIF